MVMDNISASQLREKGVSILKSVGPEGVIVTKRGRPIARLLPYHNDCRDLIGIMKGRIKIKGDILSTRLRWNADRENLDG